ISCSRTCESPAPPRWATRFSRKWKIWRPRDSQLLSPLSSLPTVAARFALCLGSCSKLRVGKLIRRLSAHSGGGCIDDRSERVARWPLLRGEAVGWPDERLRQRGEHEAVPRAHGHRVARIRLLQSLRGLS